MRLILFGHSANDLFWFILPLVLPFLLTRYSLNYSQAGGILTVYLVVAAAGSFVMGKLSDRFSPRKILGLGFILASMGLASSGFTPSLWLFLVALSFTAVGVSTFHPVIYAIIDRGYPENKGKVLGLYESFGIGAILLMYLVNGFLFRWIGIRGVMIITALPALIMGVAYLSSSDPAYSNVARPERPAEPLPIDRRVRHRFEWFLLSIILRVLSVTAIVNFLPTVFVRYFGFAESSAALGSAFFFAGGIAGSLVAGKISDRFTLFGSLAIGSCLIALCILVFSLSLPKLAFPVMVAVFGFVASSCIINQNLLMTRLGGSLGRGEIFGILMGLSTITSAFSPALFGMIIDRAGFNAAFLAFILPVAISMGLLLYLWKSDRPRV